MNIFSTNEFEIKTGRTIEEMTSRLKLKGQVNGDKFAIYTEPYSIIPLTNLTGQLSTNDKYTIVYFKVDATITIRLFFYFIATFIILGSLYFVTLSFKEGVYKGETHAILIFGLVGYIILQLAYKTSVDKQEGAMRQLIRDRD